MKSWDLGESRGIEEWGNRRNKRETARPPLCLIVQSPSFQLLSCEIFHPAFQTATGMMISTSNWGRGTRPWGICSLAEGGGDYAFASEGRKGLGETLALARKRCQRPALYYNTDSPGPMMCMAPVSGGNIRDCSTSMRHRTLRLSSGWRRDRNRSVARCWN